MQRTVKLTLPSDKVLVKTIKFYNEVYNEVCNEVLKVAFEARTHSKSRVHRLTYRGIRQKYPSLQSSMVQCLRDYYCVELTEFCASCSTSSAKAWAIEDRAFFRVGLIFKSAEYLTKLLADSPKRKKIFAVT
jgi:predicted transposase